MERERRSAEGEIRQLVGANGIHSGWVREQGRKHF